jgi:hypothetical protein
LPDAAIASGSPNASAQMTRSAASAASSPYALAGTESSTSAAGRFHSRVSARAAHDALRSRWQSTHAFGFALAIVGDSIRCDRIEARSA